MTAPGLRVRCTPAEYAAALARWGGPPAADVDLRGTGLTDAGGVLLAEVAEVVDVLVAAARVLAVVCGSPGSEVPEIAVVSAPPDGGPYVFEAHAGDHIELVGVTSPSSALALLDDVLLLSALPADGVEGELALSAAAWWSLLAVADAQHAAHLAAELERRPAPRTGVERAALDHQVAWALRATDARWLLGVAAAGDRALVVSLPEALDDGLAGLEAAGLVALDRGAVQPTAAGWEWIGLLTAPVRVAHLHLTHHRGGVPEVLGSMTVVRAATAALLAQHGPAGTTVLRTDPMLVGAILREVLAVPVTDPEGSAPPAATRAFVDHDVDVLAVDGGSEVVGTLAAGSAVTVLEIRSGWAHVTSGDGATEGWLDAAALVGPGG